MRQTLFRLGFPMLSSLSVVFAVACGGGAKDGSDPKSPTSSTSSGDGPGATSSGGGGSSGGGSSAGGSSGGGSSAGSSSGTTTTQLGDGGDLQGAKLGGKVHSETETKGESGPKNPQGSASEPGRAAKDIQVIVAARRDEARACYDKGLAGHPGIEGDLDIKWVIDPTGAVTDASVDTTKSQILEPSVGTCIIDVIKKIKFAASAKGFETRAHYPFNFHPKTYTAKDAGK